MDKRCVAIWRKPGDKLADKYRMKRGVTKLRKQEVLLEAQHLKKHFPVKGMFWKTVNSAKAVDDVSLKLYKGETLGIVGETGCGKSTLARTLLKLEDPTDGRIILEGTDITDYTEKQMRSERRRIQMVFQDPYTSLNPKKRMGAILEEALAIQGIKEDRQERAMEIISKVGLLKEHYYRYPHEFSGGQKQRIGIARALILNPSIVICDEPVSALDVSIQSQIINLLLDIQEERELSYLFIAHDMSVVRYISSRIGVMYLGHIVEEAYTDDLFTETLHPYSQALLSAVPSTNPNIRKKRIVLEGDIPSPMNVPAGCVFHTRCPYATDKCKAEMPPKREVKTGHFVSCHLYEEGKVVE